MLIGCVILALIAEAVIQKQGNGWDNTADPFDQFPSSRTNTFMIMRSFDHPCDADAGKNCQDNTRWKGKCRYFKGYYI